MCAFVSAIFRNTKKISFLETHSNTFVFYHVNAGFLGYYLRELLIIHTYKITVEPSGEFELTKGNFLVCF